MEAWTNQTIENVKKIRHAEAEAAAAELGASFKALDLGDYPLQIGTDELNLIAETIREFAPDVLVTHTDTDPFNPDHPVAHDAVDRARSLAAGAGVQSAFKTIRPPALFLFEPHQPELCNFTPTVFVDITSVFEKKQAAMAHMKAQAYLQDLLRRARRAPRQPRAPRQRQPGGALRRGVPARDPAGGERAMSSPVMAAQRRHRRQQLAELARLGSATVYEAGGRGGYVDADLHQAVPGSRAAGPARTVVCGQDDNLMVHAVMAEVQPGEVIVLTMPEPRPVALVGDLLATQAQVAGRRGDPGRRVDPRRRGARRDGAADLGALGARQGRAARKRPGEINVPVTVGGATINPGDVLVLDADGVAVVAQDRVAEVLEASLAREEKERVKREKLQAGAKSYDLDGLRAVVEGTEMSELEATGHRPPGTGRDLHAQASGEPRVLHRDDGHGGRAPRGPVGVPARLGRLPASGR